MNKETKDEKPFYEKMPESEIETVQVEIKIPKQYLKFWNGVKCMYNLQDNALNQVLSEELIHYLNMIHDGVQVVSVIGISPDDIKEELT